MAHRHRRTRTKRRSSFMKMGKTMKMGEKMGKKMLKPANKVMAKVKFGLENVGAKVSNMAASAIPKVNKTIKNAFGAIALKSRKHR
jgi:hypothetical protein